MGNKSIEKFAEQIRYITQLSHPKTKRNRLIFQGKRIKKQVSCY